MGDKPERFYVLTKATLIEGFRAFRSYLEKVVEKKGEKLDPAWYADGPEDAPHLYKDQPELPARVWSPPKLDNETASIRRKAMFRSDSPRCHLSTKVELFARPFTAEGEGIHTGGHCCLGLSWMMARGAKGTLDLPNLRLPAKR
jgi:hypothetical protein